MLQEMEVAELGITVRHLNAFEIQRLFRVQKHNRYVAAPAMSAGMTVRMFKALPDAHQRAIMAAYNKLTSPGAIAPEQAAARTQARIPAPWDRVPASEQIAMGRKLLAVKDSLPHGHFGPWIDDQSGISRTQAARFMRAAKEAA
jgi:hypothetical protein